MCGARRGCGRPRLRARTRVQRRVSAQPRPCVGAARRDDARELGVGLGRRGESARREGVEPGPHVDARAEEEERAPAAARSGAGHAQEAGAAAARREGSRVAPHGFVGREHVLSLARATALALTLTLPLPLPLPAAAVALAVAPTVVATAAVAVAVATRMLPDRAPACAPPRLLGT